MSCHARSELDSNLPCANPVLDGKIWCATHVGTCGKIYRKYHFFLCAGVNPIELQRQITTIRGILSSRGIDDLQQVYATAKQCFILVDRCLRGRLDLRMKCIHPSFFDHGHDKQIELLQQTKDLSEQLLTEIYSKVQQTSPVATTEIRPRSPIRNTSSIPRVQRSKKSKKKSQSLAIVSPQQDTDDDWIEKEMQENRRQQAEEKRLKVQLELQQITETKEREEKELQEKNELKQAIYEFTMEHHPIVFQVMALTLGPHTEVTPSVLLTVMVTLFLLDLGRRKTTVGDAYDDLDFLRTLYDRIKRATATDLNNRIPQFLRKFADDRIKIDSALPLGSDVPLFSVLLATSYGPPREVYTLLPKAIAMEQRKNFPFPELLLILVTQHTSCSLNNWDSTGPLIDIWYRANHVNTIN